MRRRLEDTFKRFGLIKDNNKKFKIAMMKAFYKHKKTLDNLND